jgi:hypothetical protein
MITLHSNWLLPYVLKQRTMVTLQEIILKKHNKVCDVCKQPLIFHEPCCRQNVERNGIGKFTIYKHKKCYEMELTVSSVSRRRAKKAEIVENTLNGSLQVLEFRKDGKVYVV